MTSIEDVKRVRNVFYLPERKTFTPLRQLMFGALLILPVLAFLWLAVAVAFSFQ